MNIILNCCLIYNFSYVHIIQNIAKAIDNTLYLIYNLP